MPIKFVTLDEDYYNIIKNYCESYLMRIEDYQPIRKTYYVSPANSLCFMDGGIDKALSRNIFPNIENILKQKVKELDIKTLCNRHYLPIGSSIIIDYDDIRKMISAPTMLLPQNVSNTNNAYYATMSILFNVLINRNEKLDDVDIIFTSLCCGYGKMLPEESIKQILQAFNSYENYKCIIVDNNTIIAEPNLNEQPKYYMNTEWFKINPEDIINC